MDGFDFLQELTPEELRSIADDIWKVEESGGSGYTEVRELMILPCHY
jgi:hypothetical protein